MHARQVNHYTEFFKFIDTWDYVNGLYLPHSVVADFTGNQRGKTAGKARQYVKRILGWHPIPNKNVLYFECPDKTSHQWVTRDFGDGTPVPIYPNGEYSPLTFPQDGKCHVCGRPLRIHQRKSRVFRFCSETLPGEKATVGMEGEGASAEVKNTIYPAFKQWLPRFLIKRDITARQAAMIIQDPNAGRRFGEIEWPGEDIVVEFVSYSQRVSAVAGVQRISIWEDEEAPFDFHEEQLPRLLAENGDLHISLTPANRMSWTFDEIFERASIYLRTEAMCQFYESIGEKADRIEFTTSDLDIAVVQAATDDNPTLSREAIEKKYFYDDPDSIATRRFGVFRQATGRIFNDFTFKVHVIEEKRYFGEEGFASCIS